MDATWRKQTISLSEFTEPTGRLAAICGNAHCSGVGLLNESLLGRSLVSSLPRLEEAVRCSCGCRRGRIARLPAGFALPNERRVFLFHA
jgi:hypothetical protein